MGAKLASLREGLSFKFTDLGPGYTSVKNAALLTPSNAVFYRVKCFHMLFNAISLGETTRALLTPR